MGFPSAGEKTRKNLTHTPRAPPLSLCRRKADDPRAAKFAALPGVTLHAGDLTSAADVAGALAGVTRCMLVSGAFSHDQFEAESLFIEAAARAGVEVTVRVSTHSGLIKAGTKGAYGRTHHGLAAFIEQGKYRVIDLCPDWFFSNWLGNAGEAKASGKISLPVAGDGARVTMIDPRDVGTAAAAILQLPSSGLAPLLAKRTLEVKGATRCNFKDVAEALSQAAGYSITLNPVPRDAWLAGLMGYGVPRVFATSFLETYEQCAGVVPPGYEVYGPELLAGWETQTSPELLALGWRAKTLQEWANDPATKAAFSK